MSITYCFDTNSFIEPWNKRYPIDLFPDFWGDIDKFGESGIVLATEEVSKELKKIQDELYEWARKHHHIFRPLEEEIQKNVIIILDKYPRLVDTKKNRSAADPFVIAQAMASNSIVVTEEISARGSKSPKIPDVCSAFNIESINVLEFMRRVGMKFKRV